MNEMKLFFFYFWIEILKKIAKDGQNGRKRQFLEGRVETETEGEGRGFVKKKFFAAAVKLEFFREDNGLANQQFGDWLPIRIS